VDQYADPINASLKVNARPGTVSLGTWLITVTALLSVVFSAMFWLESHAAVTQTESTNASISQVKLQLQNLQPVAQELSARNVESNNLLTLFGSQKKWEVALGNIEKHLYKRTLVTSLDLNQNGSVNLSGVTDSYESYAKLYASLTEDSAAPYFVNVKPVAMAKVDNKDGIYVGLPAQAISFTFSLSLTPAMFQPSLSSN